MLHWRVATTSAPFTHRRAGGNCTPKPLSGSHPSKTIASAGNVCQIGLLRRAPRNDPHPQAFRTCAKSVYSEERPEMTHVPTRLKSFRSTGVRRQGRLRTREGSRMGQVAISSLRFPTAWFIGALTRVNHRSPCCQYSATTMKLQHALPTPCPYMPGS
jgi:hypothetical protein